MASPGAGSKSSLAHSSIGKIYLPTWLEVKHSQKTCSKYIWKLGVVVLGRLRQEDLYEFETT